MANWTIETTRIFVQKLNDSMAQTIARLGPLGGGTILHTFGYEDQITKIQCKVVGLTDKAALKAMTRDDTFHAVASPYGDWGSFKVKSASFELTEVTCQKLRPDLPETSPVFDCELELYLDE